MVFLRITAITFLVGSLLLLLAPPGACADDLTDGKAAYKKGDTHTAFKLLFPIADQGNAEAEEMVGEMYAFGLTGTRKSADYPEALKWWLRAAEQGNLKAQYWAGAVYAQGHRADAEKTDNPSFWTSPILKNSKEGLKWLRKAAEQGDMRSQFLVARMYENGDGAEKNIVQAYIWYTRASIPRTNAALNDENVLRDAPKKRDALAGSLSQDELAQAKQEIDSKNH